MYSFLTSEVGAYLCAFECLTIWHLRDLASGKKDIIKNVNVRIISVPQFEGLTIEDMMEYARPVDSVMNALPPLNECAKVPRAYIANVIYSLVGEHFQQWVKARIDARN